jgi:hypothetical protein
VPWPAAQALCLLRLVRVPVLGRHRAPLPVSGGVSARPGRVFARQGVTVFLPCERAELAFAGASARGSALGAMLGAPPAAETGPVRTPSGPNDWHEFKLCLKTIRRLSNSLLSTAAARRRGRIRQNCLTHVVAAAFLFPTPYQTPTVLPASRLQNHQCLLMCPFIGRHLMPPKLVVLLFFATTRNRHLAIFPNFGHLEKMRGSAMRTPRTFSARARSLEVASGAFDAQRCGLY